MHKIIDLTLTLKPGIRGYKEETCKKIDVDGWNAKTLQIYSHAGTHMDAPVHFNVTEQSIDRVDLHKCVVTAWIIDIQNIGNDYEINIKDIPDDIQNKITPNEGIVFRTGWSKYIETDFDRYRNHLPGIHIDLAKWIVDKKICFIGVEPPSVADVNNIEKLTHIHHILLKNGVIIVEGLTNLYKINAPKVQIIALPLKILNGDGAPARVIAMV